MSDLTWHLRLPERLREELEPLAEANGRTTSNLVRHILEVAARDYVAPRRASRSRKRR
jgi:predicted DNA-binding protein